MQVIPEVQVHLPVYFAYLFVAELLVREVMRVREEQADKEEAVHQALVAMVAQVAEVVTEEQVVLVAKVERKMVAELQ